MKKMKKMKKMETINIICKDNKKATKTVKEPEMETINIICKDNKKATKTVKEPAEDNFSKITSETLLYLFTSLQLIAPRVNAPNEVKDKWCAVTNSIETVLKSWGK